MQNNKQETKQRKFSMTNRIARSATFQSLAVVSLAAGSIAAGSLIVGGCASRGGILGVDCCADIPAGAVPEPAGTKVCNWQNVQVSSALADQTVLYQADFVGKSDTLSPAAIQRMARNVSSGLAATQPAIIEPSGDASLDAARLNIVNMQLASFGVTTPMVEIATPAALGLRGLEAEQAARAIGNAGNAGNAGRGTGAPLAQPAQLGTQGGFGGNLPGGIF